MKVDYFEFDSTLSVEHIQTIFQQSIRARPLRYKMTKFSFFQPTRDPHLAGEDRFDAEMGAQLDIEGPAPAVGSIVVSCLRNTGGTHVRIRSGGDVRGRVMVGGVTKHLLKNLQSADPGIQIRSSSGRM